MTNYKNFIEQIIEEDLNKGYKRDELCFRFPPEPNGYLHIGHVKAITLNFELGKKYNAPVNLRFDDTNPVKENSHFVEEIKNNIKWLGYKWSKICYASDYFEQLYKWAHYLILNDKAYIDSQTSEKIASQKGTTTNPGSNSPYRNRPTEESTRIFSEMREGKHKEGSHVLRAKIKMDSQNMLMRDPVMYRILFKDHHRTGSKWCIYPMYDCAHRESDYIEKISHSLCTQEFKPHRANCLLTNLIPVRSNLKYPNPAVLAVSYLMSTYDVADVTLPSAQTTPDLCCLEVVPSVTYKGIRISPPS